MADLARVGPIHSQSEGVVRLLHSPLTAVHLVTLLEDLPVTETLETVAELAAADLRPGAVIVNRVRPQSIEHQFRIKELRDMFGPLVLSPQLPERTSLQQAQGAAKPLHIWPGDSAQELAADFDALLDRVMRTGRIPTAGEARA